MADFTPYATDDIDGIRDFIELDEPGFKVPFSAPEFQPNFSTVLVVDNLPKTTTDKMVKMKTILASIYVNIDDTITVDSIFMPIDEATSNTLGFCFMTCSSKAMAAKAKERTNDMLFGKKNKMRVTFYEELQKLQQLSDEYAGFTETPFRPRPDPTLWLTDSLCRDQFVVRHGGETEIYWGPMANDEEPTCHYDGSRQKQKAKSGTWCESYVVWSPKGTYLATFHNNGILLWGGDDFQEIGRFPHEFVDEIVFSPCEKYMVTYRLNSGQSVPTKTKEVIVWSITQGKVLRMFDQKSPLDVNYQVEATVTEEKALGKSKMTGEDKGVKKVDRLARGRIKASRGNAFVIREDSGLEHVIPKDMVKPLLDPNRLRWSPDGKYLAKIGVDMITVYKLPEMTILDKKSIAATNVLNFQWSPTSNYISYYVPASGSRPALVNIVEIPTRREICSRKAFDVVSGRMSWQGDGNYLGVFMTKLTGKNKSYVLLFFRVNEPGVPVEMLELKEPVHHLTWEPMGDRLALVHGQQNKNSVSFYSMGVMPKAKDEKAKAVAGPPKNELHLLYTKTDKKCSEVIWSPAGNVAVMASYTSSGASFEFQDVTADVCMASREHDKCKGLVWDPSGRILASTTRRNIQDTSRSTLDDGYHLYSFQGLPIVQVRKEKLYQFQWRPRPKNLFTNDERKKIIKNLKKYEREFDREDKERKNQSLVSVINQRKSQACDYLVLLAKNRAVIKAVYASAGPAYDGFDENSDDNYVVKTETIETVLSKKKA